MSSNPTNQQLPITIKFTGEATYLLTADHPASSYGQPVLIDENGQDYGPEDIAYVVDPDFFGDRSERTASKIVANWCRSHMPDAYAYIDPAILRFAGLDETKTGMEEIAKIPLEDKN